MNFREFVAKAEEHLTLHGWTSDGHNGVWEKFRRGHDAAEPFPGAIVNELMLNGEFSPVVEEYLLSNGWTRLAQTTVGWPVFARGNTFKALRAAMLEQLKLHRLSNEEVAPRPTPTDMKNLLSVESVRRQHQTPTGTEDTILLRRV